MTGLIVAGSILLLLLVLLFTPARVKVFAADGKLSARARYLFLAMDFSPEALAKRAEKKAEEDVGKEVKEKEAVESKPKAEKDTFQMILTLLKSSRRGVGILRRHLIFSKVRIYLRVGGADAHQAAIRYSQFGMLVSGFLDVIGVLFVLKKPKVGILPDFINDQLRYEISMRISIRPVYILGAGISVFYRFFRIQMGTKKKGKRDPKPTQTQKAG